MTLMAVAVWLGLACQLVALLAVRAYYRQARRLVLQGDPRTSDALRRIISELGIPGAGYPSPVANASKIARDALARIERT